MTQDVYCAKGRGRELAEFLGACVKEGGLTKAWLPKAKAMLEGGR